MHGYAPREVIVAGAKADRGLFDQTGQRGNHSAAEANENPKRVRPLRAATVRERAIVDLGFEIRNGRDQGVGDPIHNDPGGGFASSPGRLQTRQAILVRHRRGLSFQRRA